MHVFVSYQRTDTLFAAHAVGYALRAAGHRDFVDTGSIAGGEAFRRVIKDAVAEANLMFAMIGPGFDVQRLHEPANVVTFEWRRAQFHGIAVVPVLVDGGRMPALRELPTELRWFARPNAPVLRRESLASDIAALIESVPRLSSEPRHAARVLWVDDRPAGNERERTALRKEGIVFDNVVSTAEALDQLANETYDLIITDLGRRHSSDASLEAGVTFLRQPVVKEGGPPVIVYADSWAEWQRGMLIELGAAESTASRSKLIHTVLAILGRSPTDPIVHLHR